MNNSESFSVIASNKKYDSNVFEAYKRRIVKNNDRHAFFRDGVNNMAQRLEYRGGEPQQDRMIRDKYKSFQRALYYSYQGALVKKHYQDSLNLIGGEEPVQRALINPNKLKQDYDDKIISIGFESGYKPGDVFEWVNTNTHWLIYLQDLTELAYFRGDIRKCSFSISWMDEDGEIKNTYAAIRGPVETKINFIQKHGISVDTPNYSLNILMPKNEDTVKYFKRYAKFYITSLDTADLICWRVEAVDSISMAGIIEINAVEYYANKDEDNLELGLVKSEITQQKFSTERKNDKVRISGDGFIRPHQKYIYTYKPVADEVYTWGVDKKDLPVKFNKIDDYTIEITWESSYSGQFNLSYGPYDFKTIVVESLF